jgi:hypothetical protein
MDRNRKMNIPNVEGIVCLCIVGWMNARMSDMFMCTSDALGKL